MSGAVVATLESGVTSLAGAAVVFSAALVSSELAVAGVAVPFKVTSFLSVALELAALVVLAEVLSDVVVVLALALVMPETINPPSTALPMTKEAAPPPFFFFLIANFKSLFDLSLNIFSTSSKLK